MADPTLSISSEKVCFIIVKAREFDVQDVDDRSRFRVQRHRRPHDRRARGESDNPVAQELRVFIAELGEEEKADLSA